MDTLIGAQRHSSSPSRLTIRGGDGRALVFERKTCPGEPSAPNVVEERSFDSAFLSQACHIFTGVQENRATREAITVVTAP